MRKVIEAAVIIVGTLGWWGFVYPELSLTQDFAVQAYQEKENAGKDDRSGDRNTVGDHREVIRMKSRIAEYICEIREKETEDREND